MVVSQKYLIGPFKTIDLCRTEKVCVGQFFSSGKCFEKHEFITQLSCIYMY